MKIRLQQSQPTSEEYLMIGVSSALKDYQLSHFFNRRFSTQFIKQTDIPFYGKQGLKGRFAFYYYYDEDLRMDFYLFSNYSKNTYSIATYKHFEYFVLFKLSSFLLPVNEILKEMRTISGVNAALQIPLKTIKTLDEILEDIELHLLDIQSKNKNHNHQQWLWNKRALTE